MVVMDKAAKRKYALGIRRIEYGVWGHLISLFYEVTLTTRQGDDMSVKRFGSDFRKLIARCRKRGYHLEYCGCYELTPKNELLHWHGLFRVAGGFLKLYEGAVRDMTLWQGDDGSWHSKHIDGNRQVLGTWWNEFHGAFRVSLSGTRSFEGIHVYIVKHMLKDYLVDVWLPGGMRNKFLVSHGWMREGHKEISSEFKDWWVNGSGEVWMSRHGYEVMNKVLKNWCFGEAVIIKMSWGHFIVDGVVREAEIYAFARSVSDG